CSTWDSSLSTLV
nr:immunoglobulin light chain junction region [Macaca mulatta]